jgi:flavin-dependent dehydrogenase
MPVRATKRGTQRVPFGHGADADVLICGASFAGLAVARELRATGARVLVLDRYEIGERQTSACAAPTEWLRNLGLEASIRQTFGSLLVHTPGVARVRWALPFTFSTFDYPQLCALLWEQSGEAAFETAKVDGRSGLVVRTDRGEVRAPLVVDALGWRRVLGAGENVQPPDAALSRGLEVHPAGSGDDLELWIDPRYVDAGYGWSFPARDELRIGVGSFDPRDPVKQPTLRLVEDVSARPDGYQGNWIPHRLRPAAEDGVFFAGDSAGHCLPLTAEGIRTAFYFGIALGRELRAVVEGRRTRSEALRRYAAFSDAHRWKFDAMLRVQRLVPRVPPRLLAPSIRAMGSKRFVDWSFRHYLDIAPPSFALAGAPRPPLREPRAPLAAGDAAALAA